MIAPSYITSSNDVQALVARGEPESLVLEYKEDYNPNDPAKKTEAVRDLVQFANSAGGVLIYGIREPDPPTFPTTPQGIVGVRLARDATTLRGTLTQLVSNLVTPAPLICEMLPFTIGQASVLAVNVYPSAEIVSVWTKTQDPNAPIPIEFPFRTSHGKRSMNPAEVVQHMLNMTRGRRLRLASLKRRVNPGPGLPSNTPLTSLYYFASIAHGSRKSMRWDGTAALGALHDHDVELVLTHGNQNSMTAHVPYEWIREAWADARGGISMTLDASVSAVQNAQNPADRITVTPL